MLASGTEYLKMRGIFFLGSAGLTTAVFSDTYSYIQADIIAIAVGFSKFPNKRQCFSRETPGSWASICISSESAEVESCFELLLHQSGHPRLTGRSDSRSFFNVFSAWHGSY